MGIDAIVERAAQHDASDVHIAPGVPLRYRINGELVDADANVLAADECEQLAREVMGERYREIKSIGEYDMAGTYAHRRCRLNLYRSQGHMVLAVRLLAKDIPDLGSLGLPPAVLDFPRYRKGIVLVTGETGSGKSTTLAALLDSINRTRSEHIITLEDPIEYIYQPDRCSIDQREIGSDTESYANGLRAILREDPDVILIGEMRDLDTIETALTAAETGHLVFSTLHTQSAPDSIDRLVDVFPEGRQRQIRLQLSQTLAAVVSQQLLTRRDESGRCAACEVMVVNAAIRNLIREGKTPQIANSMATSADIGSITMDNALIQLMHAGKISSEVAQTYAFDPEYVRRGGRR
ncbi:MAG: PilT/PilU family type 4a pilus ATPase [Eggerthellaceae bacterium]|jgi:twitching motility protein PilT|nr:PilT/PilU family type 4a pilus ATPase [Eggerthellaceae bacterium]MCH4220446.1 PilT/PilU family type 4a pilus ATPase [Eggerthellaceae bacterium]